MHKYVIKFKYACINIFKKINNNIFIQKLTRNKNSNFYALKKKIKFLKREIFLAFSSLKKRIRKTNVCFTMIEYKKKKNYFLVTMNVIFYYLRPITIFFRFGRVNFT